MSGSISGTPAFDASRRSSTRQCIRIACTAAWQSTTVRSSSGCGLASCKGSGYKYVLNGSLGRFAAFGVQAANAHLLQSCVRDVKLQTSGCPRRPGAASAHITQLKAWHPGQRYSRTFASPPHALRSNKRCMADAEHERNGTKLGNSSLAWPLALSARLGKSLLPVRATVAACSTLYVCLQRLSTELTRMLASHRRACLAMLQFG